MYQYIAIEEVAANAFINLLRKGEQRKVPISQLIDYGLFVKKILLEQKKEVILLASKDDINNLFDDYSEYFYIDQESKTDYICLKENISIEKLESDLRFFVTLEELLAFINDEAMAVLNGA